MFLSLRMGAACSEVFFKKKREIDKNEIDNLKKFMDRKKCID